MEETAARIEGTGGKVLFLPPVIDLPAPRPCTQLGQWRPAGRRRETPAHLPLLDSLGAFLSSGPREAPPSRPVPPPPLAQRAGCQVGRGGESPMPVPLPSARTHRQPRGASSSCGSGPSGAWAAAQGDEGASQGLGGPLGDTPRGPAGGGEGGQVRGAGALVAPSISGSAAQADWGPARAGGFCSEGRTPSLYGWRPQTPIECLTKSSDRQDRHIRHTLSL